MYYLQMEIKYIPMMVKRNQIKEIVWRYKMMINEKITGKSGKADVV